MFELIKNKLESDLLTADVKFEAVPGFLTLPEFEETAENKNPRVLGQNILLVKEFQVICDFDPATFNKDKTFFTCLSNKNTTDYKNFLELKKIDTGLYNVFANFPSVHTDSFKVTYDLASFVQSDISKIHNAFLKYILHRIY